MPASQPLESTAMPSQVENVESSSMANPETIGPYTIRGLLGQRVGKVYHATHKSLKRKVALKVLPAFNDHDPDRIVRFAREMAAAGRLKHPNVMRTTDAGDHHGIQYIAMEFVDGVDVQQIVDRDGRLDPTIACEIVRQAAAGLQNIQEIGLVHRDIKPSNLMLTKNGVVKIDGLGISSLHGDSKAEDLVKSGVLSTGDFLAPEQMQNFGSADIRSDIYSLGGTLFCFLAGQSPKTGREPQSLSELAPGVSPDLVAVVRRMMATDPGQRFQTPNEVVAAMCNWASGEKIPKLVAQHMHPKTADSTQQKETKLKSKSLKVETTNIKVSQKVSRAKQSGGYGPVIAIGLLTIVATAAYGAFAFGKVDFNFESSPGPAPPAVEKVVDKFVPNDAYHDALLRELQEKYELSGGEWVSAPNESTYINNGVSYGHTVTQSTTKGQDFTQLVQMNVSGKGGAPWDAGYFLPNVKDIRKGDRVLMAVWLRTAPSSPDTAGKLSIFVEDSSTYAKEVYLTVNPTHEWQQYLIPFEAGAATMRRVGFHLAFQRQKLEYGGLALINYGTSVPFSNLPYQLNGD